LAARNRARAKHGDTIDQTQSPEYAAWAQMLQRCYNPKYKAYKHYGGHGIEVHPSWRNEFLAFLRDVGRRPSTRHSLDRWPNNDGNYEPGNVRWATASQQAQNRRTSLDLLMIDGVTKSIADWARDVDVPYQRVLKRLRQGHDAKSAVFAPHRADTMAPLVRGTVSYGGIVRVIGNAGLCISVPAAVVRRLRQEGWHRKRVEVSIATCTPFRAHVQSGARSSHRIYLPKDSCGRLRSGQQVTVELRQ
jgi:hypothetical protein